MKTEAVNLSVDQINPATLLKVKNVIKAMHPERAPGTDSYQESHQNACLLHRQSSTQT